LPWEPWAPGDRALSVARGFHLKLWDLETREELRVLAGHRSDIWALAFGPDGRTEASAGKEGVLVWDLEAGRLLRRIDASSGALAFLPDGRLVLGTRAGSIEVVTIGDKKRWF
jgi:WD40 repeat protein